MKLVGAPAFSDFHDKHTSDFLDLQRELETKKRTITPNQAGKVTVKIPVCVEECYKDKVGETMKEAVDHSPFKGRIAWLNDKMRIEGDIFKQLFKPCCEKIVDHIKQLLKNQELKDTNTFLLVGGFSESVMLQDSLQKALPGKKVIIPDEAGLAVVKGAVIFGHRPVAITSRVAKYTYGINISPPFDPSVHPADKKVEVGSMDRCRDVFKIYIQEGETVRVGEAKSGKHITIKPGQREMLLKIFASPNRNPKFVDEEDCEYLGRVIVNLPDCEEKIRVEVDMMFGETELTVVAQELYTHTKYKAYFDFL